jgi:hypothetical protein
MRLSALSAAFLGDHAHNQRLDREYPVVLMMASSNRRVRMRSGWYGIYGDPFVDRYRGMGVQTLVLERAVNGYRVPRHSASLYVSPLPPWVRIGGRNGRREDLPSKLELEGFGDVRRLMSAEYGIHIPEPGQLCRTVADVRRRADVYRCIFERVRPRVGYTVCYYNPDGFAFNLACHELGIPAVDIQHGVEGELHFAYGQWTNVPAEGYSVLPTYFWCWSEADSAAINAWSSGLPRHHAITGGNLWLDVWREHREELGSHTRAEVDRVRRRGDLHLLYTCDRNPALPQGLVEAMSSSPASWVWWIRLHPGMNPDERQQVKDHLPPELNGRVEVDLATKAPLLELLEFMGVHVTRYSTVVVEADAAGVGSVVMDPIGEEYYARQIASGAAAAARSGDEVLRAAERLSRSGDRPRTVGTRNPRVDVNGILRELVETGRIHPPGWSAPA